MARWRLKSPVSRLFTQLFIPLQIKKTSKLRATGLCAGNSPVTGEFPAQMASNAENISVWWRHHGSIQHSVSNSVITLCSFQGCGENVVVVVKLCWKKYIEIHRLWIHSQQNSNILYYIITMIMNFDIICTILQCYCNNLCPIDNTSAHTQSDRQSSGQVNVHSLCKSLLFPSALHLNGRVTWIDTHRFYALEERLTKVWVSYQEIFHMYFWSNYSR